MGSGSEDFLKTITGSEDVDKLDFMDASAWLEWKEIPYEHLVNLDEMKELIKQHLKAADKDDDSSSTNDTTSEDSTTSAFLIEEILAHDKEMKDELLELYTLLEEFVGNIGDDLKEVITALYNGNITDILAANGKELNNNECPIVVAGETSAGKSSLLNLLLGTDVLPHSLLCATSTICRLHNSDNKVFEIFTENDCIRIEIESDAEDADEVMKEKLKPYVSGMESRDEHKYKKIEIYWPIPMLQDRVTIVDTPGVGESDDMSNRLFEYLPNAVAFIYVINSANAGGIQEDRLLNILQKQELLRAEGRLTTFDFSSTIFVCNKWDIVEKRKANEKVWDDTIRKLQSALPNFPIDQVFRMSVSEAERYSNSNMGLSPKFRNLLTGIENLVPASLKAKTNIHFQFIENFLLQLHSKIQSRINHAKKTEEEKKKLYEDVVHRLNKLNADSDKVKEGLLQKARQECEMMVLKLLEHVQRDDVKSRLLSWRDEDAPDIDAEDFEVTKLKGDQLIYQRITEVLKDWEEKNKLVKEASERLTKCFKEECKIISKDCTNVNVMIEGFQAEGENMSASFGITSVGKPSEALFTRSEKVILAVAAPLWVPLVTAASLLFLPVGIGMFIKETIRASKQRKDYMENKAKYMKEWTNKIMDTVLTEANINKFIFDIYFSNFKRKIEELCDKFIPMQIQADRKQVNLIANDRRTSHQILTEFQPLSGKLKLITSKLRFFEMRYMAKDLIDESDLHIEREIGKGNFSDVYMATWSHADRMETVAMKVLRRKLSGVDMLSQLEEVECLRKFDHKNIVKLHGVCYSNEIGCKQSDRRLILVLELCDSTLEDIVFKNEALQCRMYRTVPERCDAFKFYLTMAIGICDGLAEMHHKGYLHRDLKLSNVLVKNNTAKLCDLGFARMEVAMTGTFVGTMTHMSPELLKHESYTYSSDIYSLAIVLWEFWYGRHAYMESEYASFQTFQLLDAIRLGQRPKLEWKYGPTDELKKVISDCWHKEPTKRPSASQVGDALKAM